MLNEPPSLLELLSERCISLCCRFIRGNSIRLWYNIHICSHWGETLWVTCLSPVLTSEDKEWGGWKSDELSDTTNICIHTYFILVGVKYRCCRVWCCRSLKTLVRLCGAECRPRHRSYDRGGKCGEKSHTKHTYAFIVFSFSSSSSSPLFHYLLIVHKKNEEK